MLEIYHLRAMEWGQRRHFQGWDLRTWVRHILSRQQAIKKAGKPAFSLEPNSEPISS